MIDKNDNLLGVVTDGDIRRGILDGKSLDSRVVELMNANPKVARSDSPTEEIISLLNRFTIRHVPLIDGKDRVVAVFTTVDALHPSAISTPVVLMAGGRGQRLYPLTKDIPKPMLPIGGVPLLEIILRGLSNQGFVNVYISVNYLAEIIMDHVGDGESLGLKVQYVHEDKPLGTAGALATLQGKFTEPFIVMNSDLLTHVDLREMLSFHRKQGAQATIGVREYHFQVPFGVVNLNGPMVESMVEKPLHRSMVNAGIYALEPAVLGKLQPGEYADMPTMLGQVIEEGHNVAAFPIHEVWLDVGRPEDLNEARSDSAKWTTS